MLFELYRVYKSQKSVSWKDRFQENDLKDENFLLKMQAIPTFLLSGSRLI